MQMTPNPSELLLSEKCDQMMNQLKEEYDYVIVDTPPVGLVSGGTTFQSFKSLIYSGL